jgi:hypothetical protein
MGEEPFQFIIRHLNGLKTDIINEVRTDINGVKTELRMDISAVAVGQDDLKEELRNVFENRMKAVNGEISAVKDELRQESVPFRRE